MCVGYTLWVTPLNVGNLEPRRAHMEPNQWDPGEGGWGMMNINKKSLVYTGISYLDVCYSGTNQCQQGLTIIK